MRFPSDPNITFFVVVKKSSKGVEFNLKNPGFGGVIPYNTSGGSPQHFKFGIEMMWDKLPMNAGGVNNSP